jgi:dTDP-4-dehydrorhamnose 3,5-epimerase
MSTQLLDIAGAFVFTPKIFSDERGSFFEWFQSDALATTNGATFDLAQANCSISNRGVVRGIHFAKVPPGQGKYVTCFQGSFFDVLVDLRIGSPSFGKWESVELTSDNHKAVYIPSGVGHGFMSLEDNSIFVYLCDQKYNPSNEVDITPFDETIGISWPKGIDIVLSHKDSIAKTFLESLNDFPTFAE